MKATKLSPYQERHVRYELSADAWVEVRFGTGEESLFVTVTRSDPELVPVQINEAST